jgi:Calx-beta domain
MALAAVGGSASSASAAPVMSSSDAGAPAATLTVTPSTNLGPVQDVDVTGTGFPPTGGGELNTILIQCPKAATDQLGCGEGTALFAFVDDAGVLERNGFALRTLLTGSGAKVRCDLVACEERAITFDGTVLATTPLAFDPTVPYPHPTVTVTPDRQFRDREIVEVRGDDFRPGSFVGISQCIVAGGCGETGRDASVAGDGTFHAHVRLHLRAQPSGGGGAENTCAVLECELRIRDLVDWEHEVNHPLEFDANQPLLEVHNQRVTEGSDGGQTLAPVRVTLSAPSSQPIAVGFETVPADPFNLDPVAGSVTIPAGAVEAALPLKVVADRTDEPDAVVNVEVTSAPGVAVMRRRASLTIVDDDAPSDHPPPSVIVRDGLASEGDPVAYAEVLLSAPSDRTVTVHYETHHRSATSGSDYVGKESRLTFLPGATRHLIRIAVLDDHVRESTESFQIDLDRIEGGIVADRAAMVTITDDD